MILRNQSVRTILMWLIGLLGSLALLPASADLAQSVESLRTAGTIAAHNHIADFCLAAVKDFAFERGRTNVVLHDQAPVSPGNRQFIQERRAGTDAAMAMLLAAEPVADCAPGKETAKAYALVETLRVEADRDALLPLPERDATLPRRWVNAATDLVFRLETLTLHITRLPGTDSAFDRMSAVRLTTLRFRDVVGLESSTILALAATKRPLGIADAAAVYTLRGRSAELWSQLELEAALVGNEAFSASLSHVREQFFNELRPLEDSILRNMAEGLPAGMTLDDYAARAVTALDSIIGSLRAISDATRAHADAAYAAAKRGVLADGAVIFVSALMVALCALVIARRMTSPLNGIVTRIDSLMRTSIDFQRHQGNDEFSLVSYTLDVLEKSMAERERDAKALAEANGKLAELAVTDELTGMFNRRRFNERLGLEWARARRDGQPLAVLMIDIDHFKMYNDRYGHQAGDACLAAVARAMQANLRRPGDMAARYGGEEFVVISAGATLAQARELAERIRRAVAALALPHADSPHGLVTVSIGVAAVTPSGSLLAHYPVNLADDALYKAKEAGRNRVILAEVPGV